MIQRKILSLLFLLLLSNWAFTQAPSIRYELPTEAEAGVPFLVNMKLDRGAVTGIARIQQSWPKGFTINEKQSAGAIFSFSKTQLQILWVTLPEEQEINIQIEVIAGKDYTGKISIPSLLTFLENTTRKEQVFPPIGIEVKGNGKKTFDKPIAPTVTAFAASTEKLSPKPTTSANPVKAQTTSVSSNTDPKKSSNTAQKTEVKKENPVDKKETAPAKKERAAVKKEELSSKKDPVASNGNPIKKENPTITKESPAITKESPVKPTVPTTEKASNSSIASQITFRIQVSALPSKGDKESIAKEFGIEGKDLREENHNSLFKYTYGEYPNLTEARKKMNGNPKMKGKAFITGYRNGQRIDLEEAIRLSKEK